jgi:probable phosphoglycerate mutase
MRDRFAKRRAMSAATRTIIHVIRHGDALPDHASEFLGAAGYDDLGLSTIGQRQARALGARLARSTQLAAIVSSPTRRAYETARAVADACGLDVTIDARVREIGLGNESFAANLGIAERASAIRERLAMLAEIALRDGSWAAVPGAECASDARVRFASAVEEIVRTYPDAHVAVVSHAGTINAYFAELVGTERDFFFPAGNTSLSTVRIAGSRRLVLRLNDTAHLEDGGTL